MKTLGGHPRNWNAVKLSCLRQIQYLSLQFENENDRIRSETFASVVRFSMYITP